MQFILLPIIYFSDIETVYLLLRVWINEFYNELHHKTVLADSRRITQQMFKEVHDLVSQFLRNKNDQLFGFLCFCNDVNNTGLLLRISRKDIIIWKHKTARLKTIFQLNISITAYFVTVK